jgi:hypothetical protein
MMSQRPGLSLGEKIADETTSQGGSVTDCRSLLASVGKDLVQQRSDCAGSAEHLRRAIEEAENIDS